MKSFLVRSNTSATENIPNEGGSLVNLSFDTEYKIEGSDVSYSANEFTLAAGIYLIAYSSEFFTADTTNNERISIQTEIWIDDALYGGFGHGYIRKSTGQQTISIDGSDFLDIASSSTLKVRAYRTDNSTSGSVDRLAAAGAISIIKLEDTDEFGLYESSGTTAITSTIVQVGINTTTREDTGISLASNEVTLTDAGQYVVNYSVDLVESGTSRVNINGAIRVNGTVYGPSSATSYIRGNDGNQEGGISWVGIITVSASDTVDLSLISQASVSVTGAAGAKLNVWKLPATAKSTIIEATGGNANIVGEFAFDTEIQSDDIFSYTATNAHVTVSEAADILVMATLSKRADNENVQRATPVTRIAVDDTINTNYSGSSYYRHSGGNGSIGHNIVGVLPVTASQEISLYDNRFSTATGSVAVDTAQLTLLNLDSIYPAVGDQDVLPSTITSDEVLFSPTISFGAVAVTPNTITSDEVVFNPTISTFLDVSPNAITSDEVVFNPTINLGSISVIPTTITSDEVVFNPTINLGSVTVTPNTIASDEVVFNPELLADAITVTPNTIATNEIVFNPVITTGEMFVTPNTITSDEVVFAVEVLVDTILVSPEIITSDEIVFNPSISVGSISVLPNTITSDEVVFNPNLALDAITITPNIIISDEVVFNPTLTPGEITVQVTGIPTSGEFYTPVIEVVVLEILPEAIASSEFIANPTIITGEVVIQVEKITSNEDVFNPVIFLASGKLVFENPSLTVR